MIVIRFLVGLNFILCCISSVLKGILGSLKNDSTEMWSRFLCAVAYALTAYLIMGPR